MISINHVVEVELIACDVHRTFVFTDEVTRPEVIAMNEVQAVIKGGRCGSIVGDNLSHWQRDEALVPMGDVARY